LGCYFIYNRESLNPLPKQRSEEPSLFGCCHVNPPSNQRRAKALRYEKPQRA
jgi:hypothetical protein